MTPHGVKGWVVARVAVARNQVEGAYDRRMADHRRPSFSIAAGLVQAAASVVIVVVVLPFASGTVSKLGTVAVGAIFAIGGVRTSLRGVANVRLAPLLAAPTTDITNRAPVNSMRTPRRPPRRDPPPFQPWQVDVEALVRDQVDGVIDEMAQGRALSVRVPLGEAPGVVAGDAGLLTVPTDPGDVAPTLPPRRFLLLWVFANEVPPWLLVLTNGLGRVYHLCGGGALASHGLLEAIVGTKADQVEATRDDVSARIAEFDRRPQRDVHSMLCNDATWQFALDELLERADAVVMDVTAFGVDNRGCEYELERLVDTVDLARVVLFTASDFDHSALDEALRSAWATMDDDSPNFDPAAGPLVVVRLPSEDDDETVALVPDTPEERRRLADVEVVLRSLRGILIDAADRAARPSKA